MNIQSDFQNVQRVQGAEGIAEPGIPVTGQKAGEASEAADTASLTSAAVALSESAGASDVRIDKVASMQAALASGDYQINSTDVAAKLIEHMQANKG